VTVKATGVVPEPLATVDGVRVKVAVVGRPVTVMETAPGRVEVMSGVRTRE
jgi:hypothetical protein